MRVEFSDDDLTLPELSNRIHGKRLKKQPELTDRLLAANPHLADAKSIPKGTPILVPDGDPTSDSRLGAAVARAQKMLDDTALLQRERLAQQAAALEERINLIKSVRPGLASDAEIVTRVDEMAKNAKKSAADVEKQTVEVDAQLQALRQRAVTEIPTSEPFPKK